MAQPQWIELDGAVNVRDLGGLPTDDGREVRPGRLIRSDNLQGLSDADVHRLVDDIGVRSIVDLRTGVEVRAEGPGPMTRQPRVRVRHLSLFPETGEATDVTAEGNDGADGAASRADEVVLPWQDRTLPESDDARRQGASGVYLRYLGDRPDSVVEALRTIAAGPTIVHCAAGKDRTGVVVAFALLEVGVSREAVIEDYARTGERIGAILDRLRSSPTYEGDLSGEGHDDERHRPRADTMRSLLDAIDEEFGGVPAWLRAHGWTESDAAALRAELLG